MLHAGASCAAACKPYMARRRQVQRTRRVGVRLKSIALHQAQAFSAHDHVLRCTALKAGLFAHIGRQAGEVGPLVSIRSVEMCGMPSPNSFPPRELVLANKVTADGRG